MPSCHNPSLPSKASVRITEFDDVTSHRSREVCKLMDAIINSFEGRIVHQYRYYPDPDKDESLLAALALEAARRQGQFRPMYHALLSQSVINGSALLTQAGELRLDQEQFMSDLTSDYVHSIIKADWQEGYALSVHATPTLFVNGQRFYGKLTLSRLMPFVRFHADQYGRTKPCTDGVKQT